MYKFSISEIINKFKPKGSPLKKSLQLLAYSFLSYYITIVVISALWRDSSFYNPINVVLFATTLGMFKENLALLPFYLLLLIATLVPFILPVVILEKSPVTFRLKNVFIIAIPLLFWPLPATYLNPLTWIHYAQDQRREGEHFTKYQNISIHTTNDQLIKTGANKVTSLPKGDSFALPYSIQTTTSIEAPVSGWYNIGAFLYEPLTSSDYGLVSTGEITEPVPTLHHEDGSTFLPKGHNELTTTFILKGESTDCTNHIANFCNNIVHNNGPYTVEVKAFSVTPQRDQRSYSLLQQNPTVDFEPTGNTNFQGVFIAQKKPTSGTIETGKGPSLYPTTAMYETSPYTLSQLGVPSSPPITQ